MKEYRVTLDVTVQADSASAASFIAWNERYALNVKVTETQPTEPFTDGSILEAREEDEPLAPLSHTSLAETLNSEDAAFLGRASEAVVTLAGKDARLVNHGLGPVLSVGSC